MFHKNHDGQQRRCRDCESRFLQLEYDARALSLETSSASSPARGRRLRSRRRSEDLSVFVAWRTAPSALVREGLSTLDPTRPDPSGGGGGRVVLGCQQRMNEGWSECTRRQRSHPRAPTQRPDRFYPIEHERAAFERRSRPGIGSEGGRHVVISEHASAKKPSSSTPRAPGSSTRGEHCVECAMHAGESATFR